MPSPHRQFPHRAKPYQRRKGQSPSDPQAQQGDHALSDQKNDSDAIVSQLIKGSERLASLRQSTDAFRVPLPPFWAGTPDSPLWVVEAFGPVWIGYDYGGGIAPLKSLASAMPENLRPQAWVVLDRRRATGRNRERPDWILGQPVDSLTVVENDLRFEINPMHAGNVGLFLDTRNIRHYLKENPHPGEVLNLVAYTCSLGIAAASGGVSKVVNVDISKPYLEWGKRNAALNSLNTALLEFRAMEAERYLQWALSKNLRFQRVLLDPPVFAKTSRGIYRFEDDYFKLFRDSWDVLSKGGELFALTNFTQISAERFQREARQAVADSGDGMVSMERIPSPEDFSWGENLSSVPIPLDHASPGGGCLAWRIQKAPSVTN